MIPTYDNVSVSLRGINGSSTKLRMRTLEALEAAEVPEGDVRQFHQAAINTDSYDALQHLVSKTVHIN